MLYVHAASMLHVLDESLKGIVSGS
jgi:hypothetical protein